MREFGRRSGMPLIELGAQQEAIRQFYSLKIGEPVSRPLLILIHSQGTGIRPAHLLADRVLWVGYDDAIAVVHLDSGTRVCEVDLGAPFYEFLPTPTATNGTAAWAVFELGAVKIARDGTIARRFDTDLVVHHIVSGRQLLLALDDGSSLTIDLLADGL